jgi:hypothetical protein
MEMTAIFTPCRFTPGRRAWEGPRGDLRKKDWKCTIYLISYCVSVFHSWRLRKEHKFLTTQRSVSERKTNIPQLKYKIRHHNWRVSTPCLESVSGGKSPRILDLGTRWRCQGLLLSGDRNSLFSETWKFDFVLLLFITTEDCIEA